MVKESELKEGISAIIPTYKGEKFISKLLDSLVNQSIDFNLFEAIFIVNGELDSTPDIIRQYQKDYPDVNIILTESEKGASNARNKGIEMASREYTIFIDDDDFISHNYLEELYRYVKPNRVVVGSFYDIDEDTGELRDSYMTPELINNSGIIENPYDTIKDAIVITQNKVLPTVNVKESSFNPELKNGVDISYYANLYPVNDFEFYVVDKDLNANYYRLWRQGSISRQDMSYDFNITDRLKVINDINEGLKKARTPEMKSFIGSLTGGQIVKINKYIEKHPEEYENVLKDIMDYDFDFFPYKYLNEDISKLNNESRELIISYAFSPTNTTTSNVVARRIMSEKKNVDVICANLDDMAKDFTLETYVHEFVVEKHVIESNFSTDWDNILNFSNEGMKVLGKYDKIYSRANFVHSHFLALEYKLKNPDTYWRAEFSDPLIYTFDERHLSPKLTDEDYINRMNEILSEKNLELINADDDINCVCEYLTFVFANEIIFTNESQKEVMTDTLRFDIEDIINEKSVISSHPILDLKYYYVKKSDYELDNSYINFAYFGVIFSNRSFEDFINAFDNLSDEYKDKVRLHIFSPNRTLFEQLLTKELLERTVFNANVDYLEFLNLTTKFDVLIVEDSYTKGHFIKNPYLPSKLSDYKGSNSAIWAICEKGSEMSKLDFEYKSHLNDYDENINVLNRIISDRTNAGIEGVKIDKDEYARQRTNQLTQKICELIEVCESEFKKDAAYEAQINELTQRIQNLEKENSEILNSNSWKMTHNLRKLGKKFK
ncbi:glycosyltransferase family 2 protein [Methanobrevibacter millerae]|uniref:Glycosyl transferase family 2 n=1 Tax=Methanobrevibacter millerae TaxID=230361 RepID=A0A1G5WCD9_9EURY|nr:glycosyltransferase family 2 protein [Methanobrevibacter millerae]SDA55778.1 Glycosyl transferase family 2 [Methanobrevibacter millerae]